MTMIHKRPQYKQFITDSIHHVVNRGVDRRKIFLNQKDYRRFLSNLRIFNDTAAAPSSYRHGPPNADFVNRQRQEKREREKLVDILALCLMPNHFHLLLRQLREGGITLFMKKLGIGYANYFNKKYERTGALFEGRFKAIVVENEPHLIYLPFYIHFNPLDLLMPEWRVGRITSIKRAKEFLENYQWSSLNDYLGKPNLRHLIDKEFLTDVIGPPKRFNEMTNDWLNDLDISVVQDIILE